MTVFSRPAMIRPVPDSGGRADVRRGSQVRAGAYPHDGTDLVSRWHAHDLHQLVYASRGTAEIEAAGRRHLLPPQQAVIIPAGTEHRTTLRAAESVSVFFAPDLIEVRATRVLAASGRPPANPRPPTGTASPGKKTLTPPGRHAGVDEHAARAGEPFGPRAWPWPADSDLSGPAKMNRGGGLPAAPWTGARRTTARRAERPRGRPRR